MARIAFILHFLFVYLSCSFLFFFLSESQTLPPSRASFKPNLLVLPVQQDASTGLHWAYIHKRTPLMQVPVLVDLNGEFLWVNCDQHYSSSTYNAPYCHSTQCSRANTHLCHTCASASRPGCHNNTCGIMSTNPVTEEAAMGELAQDVLALQATRGSKLGPMVRVPQFLFTCAPSSLVQKGLPNNVQGVAGLGHTSIALPNQLASHFGLQRQFTLCLSGSPKSNGAILFGEPQNNLLPSLDISHDLVYTPLTISPKGEYYMQVTSIRINKHSVVPVNPSLLSTHPTGDGAGETLITTTAPYTVLQHPIFEAITQVFAKQLPREAQVRAVAPFGLCFDSARIGRAAPSVELVLDRPEVVWRIYGENLMVQALPGVKCLGLVDGGVHARAAIVIGARQLEDNLVQFDLARSRLGFSSSLIAQGTKCADLFDFANHPKSHRP